MANVNKVILIGNLTRDPQLRYLPSNNTPVVDFGMAMNRRYKTPTGEDREEVCFVDCSAFGRTAEVINQYCQKGKQLYIEGRLKLDEWEDKNGGGKRSKLKVVVDVMQLLGSRGDAAPAGGSDGAAPDGDQTPPPPRSAPPQRSAVPPRPAAQPTQQPTKPPFGEESQLDQSDIPF